MKICRPRLASTSWWEISPTRINITGCSYGTPRVRKDFEVWFPVISKIATCACWSTMLATPKVYKTWWSGMTSTPNTNSTLLFQWQSQTSPINRGTRLSIQPVQQGRYSINSEENRRESSFLDLSQNKPRNILTISQCYWFDHSQSQQHQDHWPDWLEVGKRRRRERF